VLHPEDVQRCIDVWTAAVRGGSEYSIEYRLLRASDHTYRWHLGRGLAMRDKDGRIVKWFGTCTDIHDQKTAEAQLAAANNAKDQFLAVLSHEMRTPLMPVLTTVESLQKESGLSAEMAEGLDIIRRNVELEARLIDDLLDLTRIARGKLQLNFDTVDLHEIIRRAMQICAIDIVGKKLTTTLDLSASRHHVRGDTARLQQVFWNLIKNAVKFTPQGGHVTIHSYDDPAGCMRTQVTDTGIGIEPEAIGRIFDAFEQADRSVTRQFGGLGLGLAITKALVDLHGGKLTASSPGPHRGSTFTLELRPTTAPRAAPQPAHAPPADGQPHPPRRQSIRILLVDDHRDTSRAMARLLVRMGYNVKTADTVRSALAVANQHPFDLLISDIGLPDGSGLELMRQLLAQRPIKGIALSGFGMEEDVQRSKAAGFYEHLTKPINFNRLETAIAELTSL
jgi:signal transduction histidine kinase/CheY-like chemotaxis protein